MLRKWDYHTEISHGTSGLLCLCTEMWPLISVIALFSKHLLENHCCCKEHQSMQQSLLNCCNSEVWLGSLPSPEVWRAFNFIFPLSSKIENFYGNNLKNPGCYPRQHCQFQYEKLETIMASINCLVLLHYVFMTSRFHNYGICCFPSVFRKIIFLLMRSSFYLALGFQSCCPAKSACSCLLLSSFQHELHNLSRHTNSLIKPWISAGIL